MAVEIPLHESMLAHDESAEEALERAVVAWHAARAQIQTVDPAALSAAGRESYFRLLVRIGLWSDARVANAQVFASPCVDEAAGDAADEPVEVEEE